jgi:integrase
MATSRRGRGEYSVYKDGDRWRGAISLGFDADGNRIRKKVSGRTKAEVMDKLRELGAQLNRGAPIPNDRLTVGDFLDRWLLTALPGRVDDATLDDYSDTVRLHLKPAVGRKPLTKLTVSDLDAVWRFKREHGYSPNSVRIMRTVLRKALGQAEREGLVLRNVAALSEPPRIATSAGRSLTVEQARTLLTAVKDNRHEVLTLVTLTYGLRRGEALGLRLAGLDLSGRTLAVTHSVKRIKTRGGAPTDRKTEVVVSGVKTRRSRRTLFLPDPLVAALRRQLGHIERAREAAGPDWKEHGLLFPSEVGTPLDPDNFSHWFSRLCTGAGLGHWHAHELRHSGASLMVAQGVPLEVVSEILGHASIAITKDVYGHLVDAGKRAAADAISAALMAEPEEAIGSQNGSPDRPD